MSLLCACHDAPRDGTVISDQFNIPSGPVLGVHLNEQDPRDANGNVIYDKGVTLQDTWRALEGLVDEGKCKAIGLSDVSLAQTKSRVRFNAVTETGVPGFIPRGT
jgi:hypothetical protein